VYDKTGPAGFYVAIGTSGNQFKNAPAIGSVIHAIVDAVKNGRDHDVDPSTTLARTPDTLSISAPSRASERSIPRQPER
jgi:hypothetical protein